MAKATKTNEPSMRQQDEIVIIEDPVLAARNNPDVLLGAIGNLGFMNGIREIVQNSLDQIAKGNSIDKDVMVSYDARNHGVIVEDNGQGIPLDKLVDVFAKLHSSSNYNKKAGSGYTSGKIRFCPFTIEI